MTKMVYDSATKKMIPASEAATTEKGNYERISLDGELASQLKECARNDGVSFAGKSAKKKLDGTGNEVKDKDGKAVFVTDKDGNTVYEDVAESKAKITNAIRAYAEVAIREWLESREAIEVVQEAES